MAPKIVAQPFMDYELERQKNIDKNKEVLANIGMESAKATLAGPPKAKQQRRNKATNRSDVPERRDQPVRANKSKADHPKAIDSADSDASDDFLDPAEPTLPPVLTLGEEWEKCLLTCDLVDPKNAATLASELANTGFIPHSKKFWWLASMEDLFFKELPGLDSIKPVVEKLVMRKLLLEMMIKTFTPEVSTLAPHCEVLPLPMQGRLSSLKKEEKESGDGDSTSINKGIQRCMRHALDLNFPDKLLKWEAVCLDATKMQAVLASAYAGTDHRSMPGILSTKQLMAKIRNRVHNRRQEASKKLDVGPGTV